MAFPRLTFDSVSNGLACGEWEKQRLLLTGGSEERRRAGGQGPPGSVSASVDGQWQAPHRTLPEQYFIWS